MISSDFHMTVNAKKGIQLENFDPHRHFFLISKTIKDTGIKICAFLYIKWETSLKTEGT